MKKIYLITCLLIAFTANSAFAQFELIEKREVKKGESAIPFEKYKLTSNNLTLIIHEDHSDPIVHVQVAYHVGSARESVRNSGFAHFFEHMMFQGSKNVADEEHFKIISEAGGTNNAYTSFDKTVYINTAPSNLTETLLWLEADRMGTHLDGFTEKKFNNQRDAVKNEKKQRNDNQPYGMVSENLFKTLYADHPYEWTPIGFVDDLDAASFSDLRNFFLRWYGPNNATLVVSGDVNPEEVKAMVDKYYGTIKPCPRVSKQRPKRPVLASNRYVSMKDNIWLPLTSFSFPTVQEFHKDEAALDVLAQVFGGTNSSHLYKKFVKSEEAVQASAGQSALELSGFFSIQVVSSFMGFKGFNDVETKIEEAIEEFAKTGISDEELKRTKAVFNSSFVDQLNSISGKATQLSHWHMMKGNGYNLNDEIARYNAVTKEDVMRVFKRYIYNKKKIILQVSREAPKEGDDEKSKSVNPHAHEAKVTGAQYKGLTYVPPVDNFDRSKSPTVPQARAPKLPNYYTVKYDNGLKLIGVEEYETPKVRISITMDGGHLLEVGKKVRTGTASLLSSLMGEGGTTTMSPEELEKQLDLLGAGIYWGSGVYSTSIYVEAMADKMGETMVLLKDNLFNPRFDEADFKRIKKQAQEGIKNQKTSPSVMARKAYNELLYSGSVLSDYYTGDYNSVKKITLQSCKDYYNNFYSPNVTTVSVVGAMNQADIEKHLGFLKEWGSKNVTIPSLPEFKPMAKTTIYLVDKPYAAQSVVLIGQRSNSYDFDGDYYKSNIMNFSLGGAFNSRINLNLREDKGYTYGARAFFSGNKYTGSYTFSSNIKKEATDSAIEECMKEISGFVATGITQDELDFTKSSILLNKALQFETPRQKLGFVGRILRYDLPSDYTQKQETILNGMTVGSINGLAKKSLQPNNMVIVVVGHSYAIKPGLERLGYKVETISVN
jgi:zinc protease